MGSKGKSTKSKKSVSKKSSSKRDSSSKKNSSVSFKEKHSEIYNILMWLLPIFGAIVICIILIKLGDMVTASSAATLRDQHDMHVDFLDKINMAEAQYKELENDGEKFSSENYYTGEVDAVLAAGSDFFNKFLSWSGDDEYQMQKSELVNYGMTDSNSFYYSVYSNDVVDYAQSVNPGVYYKLGRNGANVDYAGVVSVKQSGMNGDAYYYLYVTFTVNDVKNTVSNVNACVLDKQVVVG